MMLKPILVFRARGASTIRMRRLRSIVKGAIWNGVISNCLRHWGCDLGLGTESAGTRQQGLSPSEHCLHTHAFVVPPPARSLGISFCTEALDLCHGGADNHHLSSCSSSPSGIFLSTARSLQDAVGELVT
eukprot:TRINITY_DN17709_c0_g2_i17.p1 TRINITY_DN17709_c0_g2~~TRINITY_DN17709_c0_g2_i17.p1  ORF type:complete len:130 (+),score=6.24 TRINITY_DN17709_c0_g2_i17:563-952(+)